MKLGWIAMGVNLPSTIVSAYHQEWAMLLVGLVLILASYQVAVWYDRRLDHLLELRTMSDMVDMVLEGDTDRLNEYVIRRMGEMK